MMYSEFIQGTGCKQTKTNYEIFKKLEVLYNETEMSKEEIYEWGKKLVDNSKTAEEIELEEKIKAEYNAEKYQWKTELDRLKSLQDDLKYWSEVGDKEMVASVKQSIQYRRKWANEHHEMMERLKTMFPTVLA